MQANSAALFVIGVVEWTHNYEDVTTAIKFHLEDGRIYSGVRFPEVWSPMPVFARAVKTGELCLMGTCTSTKAEEVPSPDWPERWPLSYRIAFTHVLRGVKASDILGDVTRARKVRGLTPAQRDAAVRAFDSATPAAEWMRNRT